jgi:hypothetical protein
MLSHLAGWIRLHGSKANRATDGSVVSVKETEAFRIWDCGLRIFLWRRWAVCSDLELTANGDLSGLGWQKLFVQNTKASLQHVQPFFHLTQMTGR